MKKDFPLGDHVGWNSEAELALEPSKPKPPDIASESVPDTLAAPRKPGHRAHAHGSGRPPEGKRVQRSGRAKRHLVLMFLGKFWGLSAWMLELIMVLSRAPILTRVGLPGLLPLPWSQTLTIFAYAMVSCLIVNAAVKVVMNVSTPKARFTTSGRKSEPIWTSYRPLL